MSNNMNLYKNLEKKYNKQALTIEEAASELGVGVDDITEAINNGDITIKKLGKKILFPISLIIDFLSDGCSLANKMSNDIDCMSNTTVTSNETIEIVEDDKDMSKGSISYVTSAGLWIYQLDIGKTPDGKRIRKSKSFKSEDDARAARDNELSKLSLSSTSKTSVNANMRYHDYLNYYLSLELGRGTSRTRDGYFYAAKKITQGLGNIKLKDLSQESIMKYLNEFKRNYSQSTLDKVYLFLNMTLKYAFETELICKNPMKGISKPKTIKVKLDQYKAYTENELSDLLHAAKCYPDLYPIISLLMNTGIRPGELRALKFENVDFDKKTIRIEAAATISIDHVKIGDTAKRKEIISTTKSAYSIRTLPIPDVVVTALQNWREYINTCKNYTKARNSEFLFPNTKGNFLGDSVLRNRFKKFLKQEGFDGNGFTLYRFRHTMCTTLIKNGVDIPTVQRIMGDNTTDVILRIYTHINSKDIKEASYKAHKFFTSLQ